MGRTFPDLIEVKINLEDMVVNIKPKHLEEIKNLFLSGCDQIYLTQADIGNKSDDAIKYKKLEDYAQIEKGKPIRKLSYTPSFSGYL
jgi:hypothetical protein